MQAEPTLSFGVPVRNGARFLRRLLTSLEAQDFDGFGVVVCDNQSKVRLARYHSTINSSLSPMDRALGTALVVSFGCLYQVRALGERAIKLVGRGRGAATTA